MKKTLAMIAGLLLPIGLMAAEHPKEHPTMKSSETESKDAKKEHPGHEHPFSKGWREERKLRNEFDQSVKDYVKAQSANGAFKVHDDKLGKDWELKLDKVHKNKIVHLSDKPFRCFACADFQSVTKGDKTKVDLDFYATRDDKGVYTVDKVIVHKVNGQPRYTYNDKNEMVPVNQ